MIKDTLSGSMLRISHETGDLRVLVASMRDDLIKDDPHIRPVRLAYQPPTISTFVSEQTSNQQPTHKK
jgi:hypothetical protein